MDRKKQACKLMSTIKTPRNKFNTLKLFIHKQHDL